MGNIFKRSATQINNENPPKRRKIDSDSTANGAIQPCSVRPIGGLEYNDYDIPTPRRNVNRRERLHTRRKLNFDSIPNEPVWPCKICHTREIEYKFLDCGHTCVCKECIKRFIKADVPSSYESSHEWRKCPICGSPIYKDPMHVIL